MDDSIFASNITDDDNIFAGNITDDTAGVVAAAGDSTWSSTTTDFNPFGDKFYNQVWIIKVVGLFSAIASAYICTSLIVEARRRKKMERTFDRLLLCLSASDFTSSLSLFFSSWAIPANPPDGFDESLGGPGMWKYIYPQASGTTATCTAQGFFFYIGLCTSTFFTGCIAISFLLQVKYHYKDTEMRTAERLFIGISTSYALITATIILFDKGFNPQPHGYCAVIGSPLNCFQMLDLGWVGTPMEGDFDDYCTNEAELRGERSETYVFIFVLAPLSLIMMTIITCMALLFWSVRNQELRAAKWSTDASNGKYQKRVFVKSMMYISAFLLMWTPLTLDFLLKDAKYKGIFYVATFVLPLQGVLNVLIYSDINIKPRNFLTVQHIRTSLVRQRSTRTMGALPLTRTEPVGRERKYPTRMKKSPEAQSTETQSTEDQSPEVQSPVAQMVQGMPPDANIDYLQKEIIDLKKQHGKDKFLLEMKDQNVWRKEAHIDVLDRRIGLWQQELLNRVSPEEYEAIENRIRSQK